MDLDTNQKCLDDLSYTTDNGIERRISKTSIRNIVQYLLYQKSNIIVVWIQIKNMYNLLYEYYW